MILTVDEYNALEREGKKGLSNRFLEAFQPEFFSNVGFPTRIEDDKEVYKFLDSMHDGRMQWYYEDKNMQYSPMCQLHLRQMNTADYCHCSTCSQVMLCFPQGLIGTP